MIDRAATAIPTLPHAPVALGQDAFLFLDFDGTLAPIAEQPDAVAVSDALSDLLDRLASARPGRVAILSGRSAAQLDALLGPVARRLALGASHGAEVRAANAEAVAVPPAALADAAQAAAEFARGRPGIVVEVKSLGVAVHYRGARDQAEAANALAARLARTHGLVEQRGKMVAEVRAPGSKGEALGRFAAAGGVPVMIGDDLTDEDAFAAAGRLGGAGVLVGEPRETAATYGLPDVAAVLDWLRAQLA